MPRELPSEDIECLSVSMAAWLDRPRRDSPLMAISWSFMLNRPSCGDTVIGLSEENNINCHCIIACIIYTICEMDNDMRNYPEV